MKDFIFFVAVALAIFLGAMAIAMGIMADDNDTWERIDNAGVCYLHVHPDRRFWWWNNQPPIRQIYCERTAQ